MYAFMKCLNRLASVLGIVKIKARIEMLVKAKAISGVGSRARAKKIATKKPLLLMKAFEGTSASSSSLMLIGGKF